MPSYPSILPVVSFTGPVLGSGRDLLHGNVATAFDEAQLRCCGVVQLSTYICPGKPTKTPFKGCHPFQVFVIFPIHANPWTSLCKKMAERRDSQFHPHAHLTCTGKVAGLLAHRAMRHPPAFEEDYVFIVVPDTWTFLDKSNFNQPSATQLLPTTPKNAATGKSEYDDAMARFTSTKKRNVRPGCGPPATPSSMPPVSQDQSLKRPVHGPDETPTKKPRLSPADSTIVAAGDSDGSVSQDDLEDTDSDTVLTVQQADGPDSGAARPAITDVIRPHRTRQAPKKFLENK